MAPPEIPASPIRSDMPSTQRADAPVREPILYGEHELGSYTEGELQLHFRERLGELHNFRPALQDAVRKFWDQDHAGAKRDWFAAKLKVWMKLWFRVLFAVMNVSYLSLMFQETVVSGTVNGTWTCIVKMVIVTYEFAKIMFFILRVAFVLLCTKCGCGNQTTTLLVVFLSETLIDLEGFSLLQYLPHDVLRLWKSYKLSLEKIFYKPRAINDDIGTEERSCRTGARICRRLLRRANILLSIFLAPLSVFVKFGDVPGILDIGSITALQCFKVIAVVNQVMKRDSIRSLEMHAILRFISIVNVGFQNTWSHRIYFTVLTQELVAAMVAELDPIRSIAMWSSMSCGTLSKIVFLGGTEVQRAFMKVEDIVRELEGLKACPTVKPMAGADLSVLQAVLKCCWTYSLHGVEGHRAGHIVVVGDWGKIQKEGYVKGRNCWQGEPKGFITEGDCDADLLIEMNQDGAHVIDADSGQIRANKFFAKQIEPGTGGAGAAAAKHLSLIDGVVTFKISSDGAIKEFRNGHLYKPHCANRIMIPEPEDWNNTMRNGSMGGRRSGGDSPSRGSGSQQRERRSLSNRDLP